MPLAFMTRIDGFTSHDAVAVMIGIGLGADTWYD